MRKIEPKDAVAKLTKKKPSSVLTIMDGRIVETKGDVYDNKVDKLISKALPSKAIGIYNADTDPFVYYENYKHTLTDVYSGKPWKYPSPHLLEASISDYFKRMFENKLNPTVAGLCSWLGINVAMMHRWESQQDTLPNYPVMSNAVAFIHGLIEQGAVGGSVNPITYTFTSKNYHGMNDNVSIEVSQKEAYTAEEAKRIIDDLPEDIEGEYEVDENDKKEDNDDK